MMLDSKTRYWFHAKRYGWGWGFPARWEGWVVLGAWLVIVAVASPLIAVRSLWLFYLFMAIMAAALIVVCYVKGEPPRWRWGASS